MYVYCRASCASTHLKYNHHWNSFQHRLGACDDTVCLPGRFVLCVTISFGQWARLPLAQHKLTDTTMLVALQVRDVRLQEAVVYAHSAQTNDAGIYLHVTSLCLDMHCVRSIGKAVPALQTCDP